MIMIRFYTTGAKRILLFLLLVTLACCCCRGFVLIAKPIVHNHHHHHHGGIAATAKSDYDDVSQDPRVIIQQKQGPILDDIPVDLKPFFSSAAAATIPCDTSSSANNSHDPFRFEWGTWVDTASMETLMKRVNEIRCKPGVFDMLMSKYNNNNNNEKSPPLRLRIAGGQCWDCILHVLPQGSHWLGKWPTGSWSVVKPLIGVTEVAMLRESNLRKVVTSKDLRGGSDGTLGGGGGSSSTTTGGEDCVKYVGGPIRRFMGKSGKTIVLEVVIRPPMNKEIDDDNVSSSMMDPLLQDLQEILSVEEEKQAVKDTPKTETTFEKPRTDKTESKDNKKSRLLKSENENEQEDPKSETVPTEGSATMQEKELKQKQDLGTALGMTFEQVGGLDAQLDAIARRVLASRANPAAARRLGVSHVRGILLSGPPGCGKTLLARELARLLDAREPQIVNGPEILDKFIGEAEKKVRALFEPAKREYAESGDDSALHIVVLDEMDAIAKKRGSASSDTTGVRDSVVNQLLSCMDGIKEANNVLVVGLTNRPELIDPAMMRPGRLEVQLRVELPDRAGRRDIFRIHTRQMKNAGALSSEAVAILEDMSDNGIPARSEHFSGAEIAGLVRSAASFALARTVQNADDDEGIITVEDLEKAMKEVLPALGKQDEVLRQRFPLGISACSPSMERIMRDLKRFSNPRVIPTGTTRLESLLLVGGGINGGAGATALSAWAAAGASSGGTDYVRLITALDLLSVEGGGGDEARAAALVDRFGEAREMSHSLLVLDDVDQLCAGTGPGGYSSVMLATLRALLRTPPESSSTAKAGGQSPETTTKKSGSSSGKTLQVIAATSRSDAACGVLNEIFDETLVVPQLSHAKEVQKLFEDSLGSEVLANPSSMARLIIDRRGRIGCKTALRLAERAVASAKNRAQSLSEDTEGLEEAQVTALTQILDDLEGDELSAEKLCEVF